jgi:hypothetical protein
MIRGSKGFCWGLQGLGFVSLVSRYERRNIYIRELILPLLSFLSFSPYTVIFYYS